MLSRYGYEFEHEGGVWAGYSADNPSKTGYNLKISPMSYLASGQVGLDTGTLSYYGMWGFWWHNTVPDLVVNAYYSSVINNAVIPSRHTSRAYGYSLRFIK